MMRISHRNIYKISLYKNYYHFNYNNNNNNNKYSNITQLIKHNEKIIFDFFNDMIKYYKLNSNLRVAGGWVRDKLLGINKESDIDITVDDMTGYELAKYVRKYRTHAKQKVNLINIKANPDQSRHLETVVCDFGFTKVDLVHLRSEEYGQTRIPSVQLGTPLMDAERRDFTINALFYNLKTNEIEDFTGKGLIDLNQRILRTPMNAEQTFLDDPLRMLRGVRFLSQLSQFKFTIAEDALEAMKLHQCKQALEDKISKERIGMELERMFEYVGFSHGLCVFNDCNLLPIVYNVSTEVENNHMRNQRILNLEQMLMYKFPDLDKKYRIVIVASTLLFNSLPLRKTVNTKVNIQESIQQLYTCFKWKKSISRHIALLATMTKRLLSMHSADNLNEEYLQKHWLDFALEIKTLPDETTLKLAILSYAIESNMNLDGVLKMYNEIESLFDKLLFFNIFQTPPLINGNHLKELVKKHHLKLHGVEFRQALTWCLAEQIRSNTTDRNILLEKFRHSWK